MMGAFLGLFTTPIGGPLLRYGLGALVVLALVAGVWSHGRDYQRTLDQAERDRERAEATAAALAAQARHVAVVGAMGQAVDQLTRSTHDAKIRTDPLRADLAAGRLRLTVPGACDSDPAAPATSAGGGDAAARGVIPGPTAAALADLAAEADDVVRQLTACQQILRVERVK